jgi:serine/threonine-protein kinase haspin
MFNSLSLRISDALGKMSRRSSVTGEEAVNGQQQGLHAVDEGEEEEETENIAGGVSRTSKVAEIFTIEEEEQDKSSTTTPAATLLPAKKNSSAGSVLAKELEARLTISSGGGSGNSGEEKEEVSPQFSELAPLEQLLRLCGQEAEFESLPSMDELLGRHVDLSKVNKIGEGTFGEAFKAGNLVLKIVPMEGTLLVNGEAQKRAEEILAEVAITLTLSGLRQSTSDENTTRNSLVPATKANATSGFVETHGVGICRGRYASALCKEWHRWNTLNKSENDSVDVFEDDQLFVVRL